MAKRKKKGETVWWINWVAIRKIHCEVIIMVILIVYSGGQYLLIRTLITKPEIYVASKCNNFIIEYYASNFTAKMTFQLLSKWRSSSEFIDPGCRLYTVTPVPSRRRASSFVNITFASFERK